MRANGERRAMQGEDGREKRKVVVGLVGVGSTSEARTTHSEGQHLNARTSLLLGVYVAYRLNVYVAYRLLLSATWPTCMLLCRRVWYLADGKEKIAC